MCGIAGIISPDPTNITGRRLLQMTDALAHRGPDGEGQWLDPDGSAGLGHRRLSIVDLSAAGAQPMNYLDRYMVVHNGEIYNHPELRSFLQSKGYGFSSRTDTELIPAAYDYYGSGCVAHFEGMFAFALWDRQERILFLARDRFGEKPLFLYQDETQLLFASEMKALWAAGIKKEINHPMLFNFITIGYTQNPADPTETFYNRITKLPARSWFRYDTRTGHKETHPYWDPRPAADRTATDISILEEFDSLLSASVSRRLRSDVPVGTSLSGGLDSSAIAAHIRRLPGAPLQFPTFSAVFPGFEKDESAFIRQVMQHVNLTNFTTTPTAADLLNDLPRLAAQQEEPFQSASIYAQYRVYALAADHRIKVLLDGQGADELLAGYLKYYPWYWRELSRSNRKLLAAELTAARQSGVPGPWTWKHRLAAMLPDSAARFQKRNRLARQRANPDLAKDFVRVSGISYYDLPHGNRLNDVLYYNALINGMEELLRYADRNSMAHGVEIRLPFLDHRLAEFLFSLPAHFKIRDGWTKWLLRMNTRTLLPPEIVWRKDKTGYEPPQQSWMSGKTLRDSTWEARRSLVKKGILDQTVLQKKIQPMGAHAAENYDWRYLVTAACFD